MKVLDDENLPRDKVTLKMAGNNNGRAESVPDRQTRNTNLSSQPDNMGDNQKRHSEMSVRGRRKLKRLRRMYQAELVKNMAFSHSARPYIALGSKPLSVQRDTPATDGQTKTGDAMEQLD